MNPTQYIASNIMTQFLPQVISDLGECDICDLVSLYLDRGELPHPLEVLSWSALTGKLSSSSAPR